MRALSSSFWLTLAIVVAVSAAAILLAARYFGLTGSGAVALYFVIWWTTLFIVLPFGVRSQAEAGEVVSGTEPGAPAAPALREKALWTTFLASALLVLAAAIMPLAGL